MTASTATVHTAELMAASTPACQSYSLDCMSNTPLDAPSEDQESLEPQLHPQHPHQLLQQQQQSNPSLIHLEGDTAHHYMSPLIYGQPSTPLSAGNSHPSCSWLLAQSTSQSERRSDTSSSTRPTTTTTTTTATAATTSTTTTLVATDATASHVSIPIMSSVVLSQHTPQHTPQPRLLSLSRTAFDFLSRLTAPMNTGLNSSSLNSLNGSLTERTPLLPNSSSTSLFTDEGFPDDPPPYYSSDVESNPDELPTYAQVQVLSPNQHGDEDEDWVDKCSNCVMPFFFFMLLIGAAFLTILPLTWSDPPLNTSPTPGPPMVPIPYIQPSPSRPYPSSKYTQPRAQSPDTLTSTHTPSTYDSSSPPSHARDAIGTYFIDT
ncbi:hypothetical protein BASA61_001686 [Batrachochytrium salamandrivorans]|nr:hypothetical protein BASA61_001686 [Batrachochytrium salamandrivorans]